MTRTRTVRLAILIALLFDLLISTMVLLHLAFKRKEALFLLLRMPFLLLIIILYLVYIKRERSHWQEHAIRLQAEGSRRTIEGLQTQRHDFRNQLQVMHSLASLGRNKEIQKRIEDYNAKLNMMASLTRIEDPTLQAVLLTVETKARELGVAIQVDCRVNPARTGLMLAMTSHLIAGFLEEAIRVASQQKDASTIEIRIWEEQDGCHFALQPDTRTKLLLDQAVILSLEECGGKVTVPGGNEVDGEVRLWLPLMPKLQKCWR